MKIYKLCLLILVLKADSTQYNGQLVEPQAEPGLERGAYRSVPLVIDITQCFHPELYSVKPKSQPGVSS